MKQIKILSVFLVLSFSGLAQHGAEASLDNLSSTYKPESKIRVKNFDSITTIWVSIDGAGTFSSILPGTTSKPSGHMAIPKMGDGKFGQK